MAITSSDQILNADSVANACKLIDDVVGYLNSARESISSAKSYCDTNVFCTNEGNPFPADIEKIDAQLGDEITKLTELKTAIVNAARDVRSRELTELANYQEEQRRKREEEEAERARQAAARSQNAQAMTV